MNERFGELSHRITPHLLSEYPEYLRCLLQVKRAAALANSAAGTFAQEIGLRIAEVCAEILESEDFEGFLVDPYSGGGGILLNTNMNAVLADRAKLRTPAEVNASQSTADTCGSAMRLALWHLTEALLTELGESARIFRTLHQKFSHTAMMARTCLQDTRPTSLGSLFEGYAELLERRTKSLRAMQENLLVINLGGTDIGSGEGASDTYRTLVLEILKEESGLPIRRRTSLFDAAQNSDDLGQLGHELALLSEVSIKVAKDLRLLASGPEHGFCDIRLPKALPGSSFFENKNNPTIPETVLQAAFLVLGRMRTVGAALEHTDLSLSVFEFSAGFALYESLEILSNAFAAWNQHCLQGIEPVGDN